MVSCKITIDFFTKRQNGKIAIKEWSETFQIFGARACDVINDGGQLKEEYEKLLFPILRIIPEEFDYCNVECLEIEHPDDV